MRSSASDPSACARRRHEPSGLSPNAWNRRAKDAAARAASAANARTLGARAVSLQVRRDRRRARATRLDDRGCVETPARGVGSGRRRVVGRRRVGGRVRDAKRVESRRSRRAGDASAARDRPRDGDARRACVGNDAAVGLGRVRGRNAREKTRETHHLSLASRSASTRARLAMGRDGTARRRALRTERPEGNWRGTTHLAFSGWKSRRLLRLPAPHEGAVARVRLPPAARGMGKQNATAAAEATTGPLSGVDVRFCLVRAARCPIGSRASLLPMTGRPAPLPRPALTFVPFFSSPSAFQSCKRHRPKTRFARPRVLRKPEAAARPTEREARIAETPEVRAGDGRRRQRARARRRARRGDARGRAEPSPHLRSDVPRRRGAPGRV